MEYSMPWDGLTDGDATRAPYSATEWDDMYESMFGSLDECGVIPGIDGELEVTGAATPVSVAAGAGLVLGKFFRNTSATTLDITSPTGATRRDWIVLRSCWVSTGTCSDALYSGSGEACGPQKIRICHKQNPDEDLTPPALEQTDGIIWEIPLAYVDVTVGGVITVTDLRQEIYGPCYDEFFSASMFGEGTADWTTGEATWAFDPSLDESVALYWRAPSQFRAEKFQIWVYWAVKVAPVPPNDTVYWSVYVHPSVPCEDPWTAALALGVVYATDDAPSEDCLIITELDNAVVSWPVDVVEPGDLLQISAWRLGTQGADDYPQDAYLLGVRIKLA